MKLTKREKTVCSCTNPYYEGFATKKEVKLAKLKARGKYWYDCHFDQFVSFSPNGKRQYFDVEIWGSSDEPKGRMRSFNNEWKRICRKVAALWAKGKCKHSLQLYRLMLDFHGAYSEFATYYDELGIFGDSYWQNAPFEIRINQINKTDMQRSDLTTLITSAASNP